MKLLLDTNALLWSLNDSPRLGRKARARINAPASSVWVSAASCWEIAIKVSMRRLNIGGPPDRVLGAAFQRSDFIQLPISADHAYAVYDLTYHHTDPFDRILIAQAEVEGLTIVTADEVFRAYRVPVLDATE